MSKIQTLASRLLADLNAALQAGEDLRHEKRGIGVRLRALLTMTEPAAGPVREARRAILTAIGRSELGDQIRRGGACHAGAERAVDLPENTDTEALLNGLRRLAEINEDPAQALESRAWDRTTA
jgi:hypothetical protein